MKRFLPALLTAAMLGACTDIIPDTRENAYEYRYLQPDLDLSFLWARSFLPVRIWADPDGPLYEQTRTAIARWEGALLYGEFRAVMVADSNQADIIVNNTPPFVETDPDPEPEIRLPAFAPQCNGETDYDLDFTARTITLPVEVYVFPNGTQEPAALTTCYRLTTTHELGHALGIMSHSPDAADVMYAHPVLDGISVADRQTMELVFHTTPTLTLIGRRP